MDEKALEKVLQDQRDVGRRAPGSARRTLGGVLGGNVACATTAPETEWIPAVGASFDDGSWDLYEKAPLTDAVAVVPQREVPGYSIDTEAALVLPDAARDLAARVASVVDELRLFPDLHSETEPAI